MYIISVDVERRRKKDWSRIELRSVPPSSTKRGKIVKKGKCEALSFCFWKKPPNFDETEARARAAALENGGLVKSVTKSFCPGRWWTRRR